LKPIGHYASFAVVEVQLFGMPFAENTGVPYWTIPDSRGVNRRFR
jgi:hypothetical protein